MTTDIVAPDIGFVGVGRVVEFQGIRSRCLIVLFKTYLLITIPHIDYTPTNNPNPVTTSYPNHSYYSPATNSIASKDLPDSCCNSLTVFYFLIPVFVVPVNNSNAMNCHTSSAMVDFGNSAMLVDSGTSFALVIVIKKFLDTHFIVGAAASFGTSIVKGFPCSFFLVVTDFNTSNPLVLASMLLNNPFIEIG
jgi:hypothetical protein